MHDEERMSIGPLTKASEAIRWAGGHETREDLPALTNVTPALNGFWRNHIPA